MKNKNEVIYTIREVLGDEEPNGFFLNIDDIKVPNYLYKDEQTQYPEIRISPFISGTKRLSFDYPICKLWKNIKTIFKSDFQIDIYSKSVPELNKIYQEVRNRINDFVNMDTIIYSYNDDFKKNDNYYLNNIYDNTYFHIGWITIENIILKPVPNIDELTNNSWFINHDGLYIQTDLDITTIQVMSIYNGRVLSNNDTLYNRGFYNIQITNVQELSELEDNEVERLMIEIAIIYGLDNERKNGPLIEHIDIGAKNG